MMEFWASRYRLLESLYDGKPRTLRDIDRNVVSAAFDEMLGRINKEVSEDGTSDVLGDKTESLSPTSGS